MVRPVLLAAIGGALAAIVALLAGAGLVASLEADVALSICVLLIYSHRHSLPGIERARLVLGWVPVGLALWVVVFLIFAWLYHATTGGSIFD